MLLCCCCWGCWPNKLLPGAAPLLLPNRLLPNPAALEAGAPPKLKALPDAAALLLAPKKLGVDAAGAPNPGVEVAGAPNPGVPNGLDVLAPNREGLLLAPKAGAEDAAAPKAGVALAPNRLLPELCGAPKAGVELAPNGADAVGPPKLKPVLAGWSGRRCSSSRGQTSSQEIGEHAADVGRYDQPTCKVPWRQSNSLSTGQSLWDASPCQTPWLLLCCPVPNQLGPQLAKCNVRP